MTEFKQADINVAPMFKKIVGKIKAREAGAGDR